MKIDSQGRIPLEPWAGKWHCGYCNARWTLDNSDIALVRFNRTIDRYERESCECSCPTCKKACYRDLD